MGAFVLPALLIGGGVMAASSMSSGGGGSISVPTATAKAVTTRTAAPIKQDTEQEKINKRLAASSLTKDWGKLTLAKPGLLGLGATQGN
jgi:hypothetical protein